ncbi:MAG: IS30 family transposase [Lachnospiraceae bacterium]|nr:IS30 family transposase [Lachnospiraceae bacterium]
MSNFSHLTLSDRIAIERYLSTGYSLKGIAEAIHRSPSTISREIRNHRTFIKAPTENERMCPQLSKPPYICINCRRRNLCNYNQAYYHAQKAQKMYETELSESRKGIHLNEEELVRMDELFSPLLKNGQSLGHIFSSHSDEIPVCRRTVYNYIDSCMFEARNIDLPRKVRYKRRKQKVNKNNDYTYKEGRTYKDFQKLFEADPDMDYVEMDTVKGKREKGKCLLTMIFPKHDFMLIFLMESCTQACVLEVFERLWKALGSTVYMRLFHIILTDNGGEFRDPYSIENSEYGINRSKIFYCDPMASYQKPHIERNHEFIRQVIPKGRSFDEFTQQDMTKLQNHINSFSRDSLHGKCPLDSAKSFIGPKASMLLGIRKIKPDDIILNSSLLK